MDFQLQYASIGIPNTWLLISFCIMCIAIIACVSVPNWRSHIRNNVAYCLLAEYMFLVLCITVFGRESTGIHVYQLVPFLNIIELCNADYPSHGQYILREILFNTLMFVPVGVLLGFCFLFLKISGFKFLKVLVIGLCLSITIELLQLITYRGCCETNDLVHNTLGCGIGYLIIKLLGFVIKNICKKQK